jgi:hypothetical protein
MNKFFIELQKASGLSNFACAQYLGISEGAVADRRRGIFKARRCELIALAIFGSDAEKQAVSLMQKNCQHAWRELEINGISSQVCKKCRFEKK